MFRGQNPLWGDDLQPWGKLLGMGEQGMASGYILLVQFSPILGRAGDGDHLPARNHLLLLFGQIEMLHLT